MSEQQNTVSDRGPRVCGEPAADRLMRSLDYRLHPGVKPLSAGRWLHDTADQLENR